jgi:hypothetical protein
MSFMEQELPALPGLHFAQSSLFSVYYFVDDCLLLCPLFYWLLYFFFDSRLLITVLVSPNFLPLSNIDGIYFSIY